MVAYLSLWCFDLCPQLFARAMIGAFASTDERSASMWRSNAEHLYPRQPRIFFFVFGLHLFFVTNEGF